MEQLLKSATVSNVVYHTLIVLIGLALFLSFTGPALAQTAVFSEDWEGGVDGWTRTSPAVGG